MIYGYIIREYLFVYSNFTESRKVDEEYEHENTQTEHVAPLWVS